MTLLVVSNPSAPYLKWLSELPPNVNYVVGNTVESLARLAEHAALDQRRGDDGAAACARSPGA